MVWRAFTGFDKSPLVFLPQGKRTATSFVKNIYDATLSAFYFMHDAPCEFVLMEDGAPVHCGKLPQLWRQAYRMQKLYWPPNSPYLNPIKNSWKLIKDLLQKHKKSKNQ